MINSNEKSQPYGSPRLLKRMEGHPFEAVEDGPVTPSEASHGSGSSRETSTPTRVGIVAASIGPGAHHFNMIGSSEGFLNVAGIYSHLRQRELNLPEGRYNLEGRQGLFRLPRGANILTVSRLHHVMVLVLPAPPRAPNENLRIQEFRDEAIGMGIGGPGGQVRYFDSVYHEGEGHQSESLRAREDRVRHIFRNARVDVRPFPWSADLHNFLRLVRSRRPFRPTKAIVT